VVERDWYNRYDLSRTITEFESLQGTYRLASTSSSPASWSGATIRLSCFPVCAMLAFDLGFIFTDAEKTWDRVGQKTFISVGTVLGSHS